MESKAGWTPYNGRTVTGWPSATFIRDAIVMKDDGLLTKPIGKPVRFVETFQPEAG